jgi:uncharacterized protein (DUF849 family)
MVQACLNGARTASGFAGYRVLVEVLGEAEDPVAEAERIREHVSAEQSRLSPRSEGARTWDVLDHDARLGLESRTGLEDTLVFAVGSPAPDIHALVRAAVACFRGLLDKLAGPDIVTQERRDE